MAAFLALVFALTWALEIPWIESTEGPVKFDFPFPLLFVMGWMPGLAAILVTGAISGRSGISALLGRLLIWRLGLRWYLVPILGSAALWIAALALDPLIGGTGTTLPTLSIDLLIGVAVSLVVVFLRGHDKAGALPLGCSEEPGTVAGSFGLRRPPSWHSSSSFSSWSLPRTTTKCPRRISSS
jgi:hypothetical protein